MRALGGQAELLLRGGGGPPPTAQSGAEVLEAPRKTFGLNHWFPMIAHEKQWALAVISQWSLVLNPRPKNRNRFLFLTQLVAVAGGVLIFGGGSYCV